MKGKKEMFYYIYENRCKKPLNCVASPKEIDTLHISGTDKPKSYRRDDVSIDFYDISKNNRIKDLYKDKAKNLDANFDTETKESRSLKMSDVIGKQRAVIKKIKNRENDDYLKKENNKSMSKFGTVEKSVVFKANDRNIKCSFESKGLIDVYDHFYHQKQPMYFSPSVDSLNLVKITNEIILLRREMKNNGEIAYSISSKERFNRNMNRLSERLNGHKN